MSVEVVKGDEYSLEFHADTRQLVFRGTVRLQSADDYAPIVDLLQKAQSASAGQVLVMDFRQLEFLNSSGINTVSKFVIAARKEDRLSLSIRGNKDIYWQQKSLSNLQKLWPKVEISID